MSPTTHRKFEFSRACCVVLLGLSASVAMAALPWEAWVTPYDMARLDPRDQVLERSSHCPGGCRYDRDARGPEDPLNNPYPDRWLYLVSGEQTVFDEPGPGALTRIWMTTGFGVSTCIDPAIWVRFYVDGAVSATMTLPLNQLFNSSIAPFQAPLVANRTASSGGFVSNVPIMYSSGLRITLTDVDGSANPCTGNNQHLLWYQFTHHRIAPGTAVTSFTPAAQFPAAVAWLGHAGNDPWNGMLAGSNSGHALVPGNTALVDSRAGSGWLRGIRLHVPRPAWPFVSLRLSFDGSVVAEAPLDRYFATSASVSAAPQGVLLGEDSGDWLYAWFPMPYHSSATVELVASASLPSATVATSVLYFDPAAVPIDAAPFFAESRSACGSDDVVLLQRRGAGRLLGVSARHRADGVTSLGYLEGDERIYLDGSRQPRWYGTGLEDFYNGGFYFDQGAFTTPQAGASLLDATGAGRTQAWRTFAFDAPTWQNSIDWRLEAGFAPTLPVPMCNDTVVYGYARPQAALVPYDRFELGDAAALVRHAYVAAPATTCNLANGSYEDEPATPRSATACRRASGYSQFQFSPPALAGPLRLRRTFDASLASVPAEVWVNGQRAGRYAYAAADPLRRWQDQDALLTPPTLTTPLLIEIRPITTAPGVAGGFGESAWELWGGWTDTIFPDGFDP